MTDPLDKAIRNGVVVRDAETGSLGTVIDAVAHSFVRVQWHANRRILKTDPKRLRYAYQDEFEMRQAEDANGATMKMFGVPVQKSVIEGRKWTMWQSPEMELQAYSIKGFWINYNFGRGWKRWTAGAADVPMISGWSRSIEKAQRKALKKILDLQSQ